MDNTCLVETIKQSVPVDLSIPYDAAWVKDKVIIVTGGASGFGAGFVRKWAANGAFLIVGDIDVKGGDQLVREVKRETGNENVHFIACDVTDYQAQVNLFKRTVALSPHGGIDAVVANAGIAGPDPFLFPLDVSGPEPRAPRYKTLDVNLTGLCYTAHLALTFLPQNPASKAPNPYAKGADGAPATPRDRHLLLLGSVASIGAMPSQPQYGAAKHAVLGLFRSLRGTAFLQGVRINMLCPYFITTPIVPTEARVLLAGGATGKVEDVVDAGTRLMADSRIVGRALVVGRKMKINTTDLDESWVLAAPGENGVETAVWECYADDFEKTELFCRRITSVLIAVEKARGWSGWAWDVLAALGYGWRRIWGAKQ